MKSEQTVFIVDDNKSVRESLSALVTSRGLAARTFESAEQFLESGDHRLPGCVVTDVRMSGMTGFELTAQIRQEGIDTPVIVITGYSDVAESQRADTAGDVILLEKSCSGSELWECIRKALEANRTDP